MVFVVVSRDCRYESVEDSSLLKSLEELNNVVVGGENLGSGIYENGIPGRRDD